MVQSSTAQELEELHSIWVTKKHTQLSIYHTSQTTFTSSALHNTAITCISIAAQLTWGGRHFSGKCMYEKLIKCAAENGFRSSKLYSMYTWNENRILSKNKGCLFFLLPKIYQLPKYYMMYARKIFFLPNLGVRRQLPRPPCLLRLWLHEWNILADNNCNLSTNCCVIPYETFND